MATSPKFRPATSRLQDRSTALIAHRRQFERLNHQGGITLDFDSLRAALPDMALTGSQSGALSLWSNSSPSAFIVEPASAFRVITVMFVTKGNIDFRCRTGVIEGSTMQAILVDSTHVAEVKSPGPLSATGGTFGVDILTAAHEALTGETVHDLPELAPVAEMTLPGLRALSLTLRQAQIWTQGTDSHNDLIFPMLQEILGYQLLSAWPRLVEAQSRSTYIYSRSISLAIDYIEANLSQVLTLAEIAAAAETTVRSLQNRFRQEKGVTPIQFIITQRLAKAHADLVCSGMVNLSIADVARRWGFVHMSDFAQRYRRTYGCTPSETRRNQGFRP